MTEKNQKPTVMVVDDQPANLKLLVDSLLDYNFTPLTAINGERALKQIRHAKPDIILLDVMMPGIDGFETCRRLKADPETADIPVIFMTALTDVEDITMGFNVGGVDYLAKPVNLAEVVVRMNTHLSLSRLNRELRARNVELARALAEVKTLEGIIPICCRCKAVRDDEGYWQKLEKFFDERTDAKFSHGYCPACYNLEVQALEEETRL